MDLKKNLVFAAKILAHGIAFSLLATGAVLLWAYMLPILFLFGSILGLILSLLALLVVYGIINSLVARLLWFPMEKGWKTWIGQGVFLALAIDIVNVLLLLIIAPFINKLDSTPRLVVLVLVIVAYAFVDGYIAMRIARHWKKRGSGIQAASEGVAWTPEPEIPPNNPANLHCPRCGSVRMVVAPDRSALCLDCNKGIRAEKLGGGKAASPPS